jgi:hypothetical protein
MAMSLSPRGDDTASADRREHPSAGGRRQTPSRPREGAATGPRPHDVPVRVIHTMAAASPIQHRNDHAAGSRPVSGHLVSREHPDPVIDAGSGPSI